MKKIRLRACPSCGVTNLYDAEGEAFTPLTEKCRSCGEELEENSIGREEPFEEEIPDDEEPTPS